MGGLSAEHLRRWADELDAEEKAELEAAERAKIEELASRETLSPEEMEWFRKIKADFEKAEADERAKAEAEPEPEADPQPEADPSEEEETKARRRTRPGRKSGAAYDFDVDEQGNVVPLDVARIYSGEDEPDRVPLGPEPEESEAA